MALLRAMTRAPSWSRLAHALRGSLPALSWIVPLAVLEVYGRSTPADAWDVPGVLGLVLVLYAFRRRIPDAFLRRGAAAIRGARELVARYKVELGLDLRGDPPVPARVPVPQAGLLVAAVLAAGVLQGTRCAPEGMRGVLQAASGLLHLAVIGSLWTTLLGAALLALVIPLFSVNAWLIDRLAPPRRRRTILCAAGSGQVLLTTTCVLLLKDLHAFALLLASTVIWCGVVLLPVRRPLRLVWRPVRGGRPGMLDSSLWEAGYGVFIVALICLLALLARGDRLGDGGGPGTVSTAHLGLVFLWAASLSMSGQLQFSTLDVLMSRLRDPDRPVRPRVHVEGAAGPADRRRVRRAWKDLDARILFAPRRPRRGDVRVRLVGESPARDPFAPLTWPLEVGRDRLRDPVLHHRLLRRDEELRRREVQDGFQRLLGHAERRDFDKGSGFWLAPHLWFFRNMTRDVDEEVCWFVGPPHRSIFLRTARAHLARTLEAGGIDLIFLEDGVGYERFARVLGMLFEHSDMFAGRQDVEERHFAGIPGVRVLIHDYGFDERLLPDPYPEPDYEGLGRARVLHVFRDRGGDDPGMHPRLDERVPAGEPQLAAV